MYRPRLLPPAERRRAVILMVVLVLLTLFAIVGLAFVLYADGQADESRLSRESQATVSTVPTEAYDSLMNYAMAELIFGVGDPTPANLTAATPYAANLYPDGAYSATRGHDLARDIYGWNPDNAGSNIYPYIGKGHLHTNGNAANGAVTCQNPYGVDDYTLINYIPYLSSVSGFTLADGFVRDPERFNYSATQPNPPNYRTLLSQTLPPYTGGWNPNYTYPDGNHIYLGAVDSNGNVLARSFHRPYFIPTTLMMVNGNPVPTQTPCLPLDPNAPGYWTWFWNTNPSNPNEIVPPYLKYTSLRMRPADQLLPGESFLFIGSNTPAGITPTNRPFFPGPGLGGDLVSLRGFSNPGVPGASDTIWVDLDYPVKVASNGVKYKPMFGFFIQDLDGKVNINSHGNIRGANGASLSNQGWCKSEINPAQLASTGTPAMQAEWPQLFLGGNGITGRYGLGNNSAPGPVNNNNVANSGKAPHVYGQVDYDGSNEGQGGVGTQAISYVLGTSCFPTFPAGYGNGSQVERTNHPLLYDPVWPGLPLYPNSTNTRFPASNLASLYNKSVLGSINLNCPLGRLLPNNMSSARIPWMITTDSYHLNRPALTPWLWDTTAVSYSGFYGYGTGVGANAGQGQTSIGKPPIGSAVAFPPLTNRVTNPAANPPVTGVPNNSDFSVNGAQYLLPPNPPGTINTTIDWRRAVDLSLTKVNLNRFLSPYPHQGSGTSLVTYNSNPMQVDPQNNPNQLLQPYDRFDGWPNSPNILAQAQQAQADRQKLANDIYRRLLLVTGVPAVLTPQTPTPQELASRRWLAQLAVNIVDYIDEDEISTPFNFYTTGDGLLPANVNNANSIGTPAEGNLTYWVFGTELPKVLLNEVLAEYKPPPMNPGKATVNIFVELVNLIPTPAANAGTQGQDSAAVPLYTPTPANNTGNPFAPYIVVVSDNNINPLPNVPNATGLAVTPTGTPFNNDAILGTPNNVRTQTDFSPGAGSIATIDANPQKNVPAVIGGPATAQVSNPAYFLVGPGPDAHGTIAPKANGGTAVVPAGTPMLTTGNMSYTVNFDAKGNWSPNDATNGVNVLLRRLMNPHIPNDPVANPYITVDYIGGGVLPQQGALQANPKGVVPQSTANSYKSQAKYQPYAAHPTQVQSETVTAVAPMTPATSDTFGFDNGLVANTPNQSYNWLMHLDRQLVSPLDLLHVSGRQVWDLTHSFVVTQPGANGLTIAYNHQVNWFDETNRLYRALEFLTTKDRTTGVSNGGRIPGMMNINGIWDKEVLRALCDAQQANTFYVNGNPNQQVDAIYQSLLNLRSPWYSNPPAGLPPQISGHDRPFQSMGIGNTPGTGNNADPQSVYEDGTNPPATRGIEDTILRSLSGTGANGQRLFDPTGGTTVPPTPQQTELMRKIYGHITTRSNVFAVWCTVGYFQVVDDTVRPVKLGAELGASTNTNIRQRFFTVIDRSRLVIAPQVTTTVNNVSIVNQPITIWVVR